MDVGVWLQVILVGIVATVVMDIWSWLQRNVLRIPSLDYGLIGRWVLSMFRGKWVHRPIMVTPAIKGETWLGWFLHYLIGVVFSVAHLLVFGIAWLAEPTLLPALLTALATLVLPFFVIQPCLGFGMAASKTPAPWKARWLSLLTHSVYGVGLFIAAQCLRYYP